jgi:co-chaperonin GroES (HSP10)
MPLRPLGSRILVKPDAQADETETGLILPTDRHHVPTSGTVVELGDGPQANQRVRAAVIARCMAIVTEMEDHYAIGEAAVHRLASEVRDEMRRYRNLTERMPGSLNVGDRVVFPVETGLNVDVDGERYIVLNEDDVAVIANEDEVAA